jgi:hypothetical protein
MVAEGYLIINAGAGQASKGYYPARFRRGKNIHKVKVKATIVIIKAVTPSGPSEASATSSPEVL